MDWRQTKEAHNATAIDCLFTSYSPILSLQRLGQRRRLWRRSAGASSSLSRSPSKLSRLITDSQQMRTFVGGTGETLRMKKGRQLASFCNRSAANGRVKVGRMRERGVECASAENGGLAREAGVIANVASHRAQSLGSAPGRSPTRGP